MKPYKARIFWRSGKDEWRDLESDTGADALIECHKIWMHEREQDEHDSDVSKVEVWCIRTYPTDGNDYCLAIIGNHDELNYKRDSKCSCQTPAK